MKIPLDSVSGLTVRPVFQPASKQLVVTTYDVSFRNAGGLLRNQISAIEARARCRQKIFPL